MLTFIPFDILVALMRVLAPADRNALRTTCRLLHKAATVVDRYWLEAVDHVERFCVLSRGDNTDSIMENLVAGLVSAPVLALPVLEHVAINLQHGGARQFRGCAWRDNFRAHWLLNFPDF
jgi:hypothetical protein